MIDKADGLASPVLKFLTEDEIAAVRKAANLSRVTCCSSLPISTRPCLPVGALCPKLAEKP